MPTIVLECPHCAAEKMTFGLVAESRVEHPESQFAILSAVGRAGLDLSTHTVWNTFLQCRGCWKGVVLEVIRNNPRGPLKPSDATGSLFSSFTPIEIYPKQASIFAPEHVPDRIAKNYTEACDSLRRQSFTSAVMMFRKVLERSTRELAPKGATISDNLFKRIEELAQQNAITEAMRDWAHVIRLDGNEAVHDEDPDKDAATQIQQFTELFLLYCFTLPERVRIYHGQANQALTT